MTGGTTHWRLVPLPHGFAWRPFAPKKKSASLPPSTSVAVRSKPEVAEALATPAAETSAVQPLADRPAVQ